MLRATAYAPRGARLFSGAVVPTSSNPIATKGQPIQAFGDVVQKNRGNGALWMCNDSIACIVVGKVGMLCIPSFSYGALEPIQSN